MLQSIRDRLTGPIVWFIVGLIVIPFAFWGVESFFANSGGDPVVVKVGDQKITQSQFRAGYSQRYEQLQGMLGANFRADMIDQNRFRQSVLDDMVQESLLRQYSQDSGYRAGDAALFDYLSNIPAFQKDGKFSAETYKTVLAQQGLNPRRFESQLRDSLVIDQLRGAVVETAFLTRADTYQSDRLTNQERRVAYSLFSQEQYLDKVSVGDEQVKQRYEAEKAKYMSPERLKIAYVELDLAQLPRAENPGSDVLKVVYDAEKDSRFAIPEERKARHILIGFGADKAAAKKKLEALAEKIKSGADFSEVARANSEDAGSKAEGGSLGSIRRGAMVKKFEDVLFELKPGEVSDPVETEFGWHLIKLDELKPPSVSPFDNADVQAQLLELYQSREAEKHYQEMAEKLEQLAFENPASLDPVASSLGLKVQSSDWLTRSGGSGIAGNEAIRLAAFSTEVLTDGENSKPLPLGPNSVAVIRKAEFEPARQRPLEEVANAIRDELKAQAAKQSATADAAALRKSVEAGQSLQAAAGEKGIAIKFEGAIKRGDRVVDPAVVAAAFKLPHPATGKSVFEQVDLGDKGVALLVLSEVRDPPKAAAEAGAAPEINKRLSESLAGAEFAAYRKAVEQKVKVKIVNPPTTDSPSTETPES